MATESHSKSLASARGSNTSTKRMKLDFSEEIAVFVGERKKRFTVHKCFLTKSSDFLEACCKGPWKESQTNRVEFPTVDDDHFSTYLQWLYTDHLIIDRNGGDSENEDSENQKAFSSLIKLAALADFLRDIPFANAVNDALITAVEDYGVLPTSNRLHTVVDIIRTSSIFYTLLVDYFATSSPAEWFQDRGLQYPPQFVLDVLVQMMERRDVENWTPPNWKQRCRYHEHNEKTPVLAECKGARRHDRST